MSCDNIIIIPAGEDCILDGGNPLDRIFSGNQNVPRLGKFWENGGEELQVFVEDPKFEGF